MSHSVVPPSSLARIVQCSGSVAMEACFPEAESDQAALDGEASHWGMAEMVQGRLIDIGQIAPNGVVLDQAMVEGADMMYDDVVRTLKPYGLKCTDGIAEGRIDIPGVHALCFGTPDYRAWATSQKLYLWDYKFGHRVVEVFEHWQLIAYVAGVLRQATVADRYVEVVVRIVQPRAYHRDGPIREWRFMGSDLRPYIERARAAATEALGPAPVTRVGPECRDCRARHACPTLQAAAMDACDVAGRAQPLSLPPAAMGLELRTLKRAFALMSARITGLEEQVLATQRRSQVVPGWAIEYGKGRTVWTVPDELVIAMARMLGVEVAKPPEAITPKQAEAKGLPAVLLSGISKTLSGAAALAEDDGSLARRVFGGQ